MVETGAELGVPDPKILVVKSVVRKSMRSLIPLPATLFLLVFTLAACSSTPKKETGILAPKCGKTLITSKDIEKFGFKAPRGKVGVMRIFATWCPYCKEDLTELGGHFRNGDLTIDNTQIMLLAYKNAHESRETFDKFVRDSLNKFGIPTAAVQIMYVDKDFAELSPSISPTGQPLFSGWQGVPFGLVFGKDGRLAFRGHFTTSPQFQDGHYLFIKELARENCPPN